MTTEEVQKKKKQTNFVDPSTTSAVEEEVVVHKNEGNKANNREGCSKHWTRALYKLRKPLFKILHGISDKAARNPKRTMLLVATLSIALLVIGLFTGFSVEASQEPWSVKGSRSIQHSDWIKDESGFPDDSRAISLLFHSNGKDVLGHDQVLRIFEAIDLIRDLPRYDVLCQKGNYTDPFTNELACEITSVTKFWEHNVTLFKEKAPDDATTIEGLSSPTYPDGTKVAESYIFGTHKRSNGTVGTLEENLMYMAFIEFPDMSDTDDFESLNEDFENDALDAILDGLRVDWQNERGNDFAVEIDSWVSFDNEFGRAIEDDIPLLPIVFVVMSVFTCGVFFKRDKVQSRALLGLNAVISVFLSIMTGHGLMFCIGVPYGNLTPLIPFIMLGIGLDDAFILSGSFERTDKNDTILKRIHETVEEVGSSITLTSLTSTLAFGLGALSSVPAITWLCLYAFPVVIFIWLYQLTFFIACLVLDEQRVQENRRDCCTCVSVTARVQDDTLAEGGNAPEDAGNNGSAPEESGDAGRAEETGYGYDQRMGEEPPEMTSSRIMLWYARRLMHPWVKILVVIGFAALAVACGFAAAQHEQKFSFTDVLPSDSYVADFYNAWEDYTQESAVSTGIYFRGVDQSKNETQIQMDKFIRDLRRSDFFDRPPDFFWLYDFQKWPNYTGSTSGDLVKQFLQDPIYQSLYSQDIVFDSATGEISTSRCFMQFLNVGLGNIREQIDALEAQRAVAKAQEVNQGRSDWAFFTYIGVYDIWEFYRVTKEELIFTTVMGVAAVTALALFFVPHWSAAFFVLPMICVLYLDLLGFLKWAGADINPVSYVSLVLSIGLMVDYLMHVLLCYYESEGKREEKTIETLRTMGSSILLGGISTFLGIIPMAFSTSEIFSTVFYAFIGLVLLGVSHGLILLPVLLSWAGPEEEPIWKKPSIIRRSMRRSMLMEIENLRQLEAEAELEELQEIVDDESSEDC